MNEQNNQEANNQQSLIEDLTINEDQAAEVKGGTEFYLWHYYGEPAAARNITSDKKI